MPFSRSERPEARQLERACLRALLRVYLDCRNLERLRLKLFLRRDVMARLMEGGFAEASHLVRTEVIAWEPESTLVNLVARRIVARDEVCESLGVDRDDVLGSYELQVELLDRIVSRMGGLSGIDWILKKARNGSETAMPREVIQLLDKARRHEIRRIELGHPSPGDGALIGPESLLAGYAAMSADRLQFTLMAENAKLSPYVEALRGANERSTVDQLSERWQMDAQDAQGIIASLIDAGVLQRNEHPDGEVTFVIPPVYHPALHVVESPVDGR